MYHDAQPSPERRRLALIGGGLAIFLAAVGGTLLVMARANQAQNPSPTTEAAESAVSPTASPVPPGAQAPEDMPTATPPPTATPLPPYEHVVEEGETLYFILKLYGYRTLDVEPAVLALNGLPSADYIQVGQTLLVPRQTATPAPTLDPNVTPSPQPEGTAEEGEAVETGEAEVAEPPTGATSPAIQGGDPDNRVASADGRFWIHTVREGETIAQIAFLYDSSVPCILQNNDFAYSGQEPIISVGQQINVCIVVTLTPTPSPTGDPFNSTPTPTPTLPPPLLLAPAHGATFGRGEDVTLQWVGIYPLSGEQRYLVIAQDLTNSRDFRDLTTSNAYTLPKELQPGIGQSLNFEWRVVVVDGKTAESPMISGLGEPRQFTWGG